MANSDISNRVEESTVQTATVKINDEILANLYGLSERDKNIVPDIQNLEKDPNNFSAWVSLGNMLSETKNFEIALQCFDNATNIDRKNGDVWYFKGQTLLSAGKYEKAIESFNEVISIDDKNIDAWDAKGSAFRSLGKDEEARKCFDTSKQLKEDKITEFIDKGKNSIIEGKYEEAIEYFDYATGINREKSEAWYYKGLSYYNLQRYFEAVRSLNKATDLDPKNGDAWYYKGESLYRQGLYDDAILSFDQTINISNNETAWTRRGQALDKLGKYDEAIESFDKATGINHENSNAWYYKGQSLSNAGKYEKAIESFDQVIRIDPNNIDARDAEGLALESLGREEDAVLVYDKMLEIDPNNIDAWDAKGLALGTLGKDEEARKCFDASKQLKQDRIAGLIDKARNSIAESKYDDSLRFLNEATDLDPKYSDAWYYKGLSFYNLQRYFEAVKSLDKATDLDRENSDAWYYKGLSYYNLQRYPEAVNSLEEATNIDPKKAYAWYYKGEAYYNLKRYADSVKAFNVVRNIEPNNSKVLDKLHNIYSNYTFEFDEALKISEQRDTSIFQNEVSLIEDLIKTKNYDKAIRRLRLLLGDKEAQYYPSEKQLKLRFLSVASYLLMGDFDKGNIELQQFSKYYSGMGAKQFEIDDVSSFKGLADFISKSNVNQKSKDILFDLMSILKGDRRAWARINTIVGESNIKRKASNRRLIALLPIMMIISGVIAYGLGVQAPESYECPKENGNSTQSDIMSMPLEGKKTYGIEIDPVKHKAYVLNQGNTKSGNTISPVDTCYNKELPSMQISAGTLVIDTPKIQPDNSLNGLIQGKGDPWGLLSDLFSGKKYQNRYETRLYYIGDTSKLVYVAGDKDDYNKPILDITRNGSDSLVDIQIDKDIGKLFVLDNNSNLYYIDTNKINVDQLNSSDIFSKWNTVKVLANPNDMTIDEKNHILYIKNGLNIISAINVAADNLARSQTKFILGYNPGAMAVDDNGLLYLTVGGRYFNSSSNSKSPEFVNGIDIIDQSKILKADINLSSHNYTGNYTGVDTKPKLTLTHEFKKIPKENIDFEAEGHENGAGLEVIADSTNHMTYVMDNLTDSVTIIRNTKPLWNVVKTVQVGEGPNNIAVDYEQNRIYVTSDQDLLHPLVVIDLNINTPSTAIRVGDRPSDVAVDPVSHIVYVSNFGSNYITVLDRSGKNKDYPQTISLDSSGANAGISGLQNRNGNYLGSRTQYNASSLTVNPLTHIVYVANFHDNSVSVINRAENAKAAIDKISVGQKPSSIAVDPVLNKTYVANQGDNTVSVIDIAPKNPKVIQVVDVARSPVYVDINPKTHMVFVANFNNDSISVIDGTKDTKTVVANIPVGNNPRGNNPASLAINSHKNILYVANQGSESLTTVDLNTWVTNISEIKVNTSANYGQECTESRPTDAIASGSGSNSPASNAIDNNIETAWVNNFSSSIQVDLNASKHLCSVGISFGKESNDVKITVSNDSINYIDFRPNIKQSENVEDLKKKFSNSSRAQSIPSNSTNANQTTSKVSQSKNIFPIKLGLRTYNPTNPQISARYIKIEIDKKTNIMGHISTDPPPSAASGLRPSIPLVFNPAKKEPDTKTQLDYAFSTPLPVDIAFDNKTDTIFLSSKKYNWVSQINATTHVKSFPILVGKEPVALSIDPVNNELYVANWGSNSVSINKIKR